MALTRTWLAAAKACNATATKVHALHQVLQHLSSCSGQQLSGAPSCNSWHERVQQRLQCSPARCPLPSTVHTWTLSSKRGHIRLQPILPWQHCSTSLRRFSSWSSDVFMLPGLSTSERLVLQHCGSCSLQELLQFLTSSTTTASQAFRTALNTSNTRSSPLPAGSDTQQSPGQKEQHPTTIQPVGGSSPGLSKAFWKALPAALAASGYKPFVRAAPVELAALAKLLHQQGLRDAPLVSALLARGLTHADTARHGSQLLTLLTTAEWAGCNPGRLHLSVEIVSQQLLPTAEQMLRHLVPANSAASTSESVLHEEAVADVVCSLAFAAQGARDAATSASIVVSPEPSADSTALDALVAVLTDCTSHMRQLKPLMQVAVAAASASNASNRSLDHHRHQHQQLLLSLMKHACSQAASLAMHQPAAATVAAAPALLLALQGMHQAVPHSFAHASRQHLPGVQGWCQLAQHATAVLEASHQAITAQQPLSGQSVSHADVAAALRAVKPVLAFQHRTQPTTGPSAPNRTTSVDDDALLRPATQKSNVHLAPPPASKPQRLTKPSPVPGFKVVEALSRDWLAVAEQAAGSASRAPAGAAQQGSYPVGMVSQHVLGLRELISFPAGLSAQVVQQKDSALQAVSASIIQHLSQWLPSMCRQVSREMHASPGPFAAGNEAGSMNQLAASSQLLHLLRLLTSTGAAGRHVVQQLTQQEPAQASQALMNCAQQLLQITPPPHRVPASLPESALAALLAALHALYHLAPQHQLADQLLQAYCTLAAHHPNAVTAAHFSPGLTSTRTCLPGSTDVLHMLSRLRSFSGHAARPAEEPSTRHPPGTSSGSQSHVQSLIHLLSTAPQHLPFLSLMQLSDLMRYCHRFISYSQAPGKRRDARPHSSTEPADAACATAIRSGAQALQIAMLHEIQVRLDQLSSTASWRLPPYCTTPKSASLTANTSHPWHQLVLDDHQVGSALLLLARVLTPEHLQAHTHLGLASTDSFSSRNASSEAHVSAEGLQPTAQRLGPGLTARVHPCAESWLAASVACVSKLQAAPDQVLSLMKAALQVMPLPPSWLTSTSPDATCSLPASDSSPRPHSAGLREAGVREVDRATMLSVGLFKATEQALDGFSNISFNQLLALCQFSNRFVIPALGLPQQHHSQQKPGNSGSADLTNVSHLGQASDADEPDAQLLVSSVGSTTVRQGIQCHNSHQLVARHCDEGDAVHGGVFDQQRVVVAVQGLCARLHQLVTTWYRSHGSRATAHPTSAGVTSGDEGAPAQDCAHTQVPACKDSTAEQRDSNVDGVKLVEVPAVLQHAMLCPLSSKQWGQRGGVQSAWLAADAAASVGWLGWHRRPSLAVLTWVSKVLQGDPSNLTDTPKGHQISAYNYEPRLEALAYISRSVASGIRPPSPAGQSQEQPSQVRTGRKQVQEQLVWEAACTVLQRVTSLTTFTLSQLLAKSTNMAAGRVDAQGSAQAEWSRAVPPTLDIMARLKHEEWVKPQVVGLLVHKVASSSQTWQQLLPAHLAASLFGNAARLGQRHLDQLLAPAAASQHRSAVDSRTHAGEMRRALHELRVATFQSLYRVTAAQPAQSDGRSHDDAGSERVACLGQLLQLLHDSTSASVPVPPNVHLAILGCMDVSHASSRPHVQAHVASTADKGSALYVPADLSPALYIDHEHDTGTIAPAACTNIGHARAARTGLDRSDSGVLIQIIDSLIDSERCIQWAHHLWMTEKGPDWDSQVSEVVRQVVAAAGQLDDKHSHEVLDLCGRLVYMRPSNPSC